MTYLRSSVLVVVLLLVGSLGILVPSTSFADDATPTTDDVVTCGPDVTPEDSDILPFPEGMVRESLDFEMIELADGSQFYSGGSTICISPDKRIPGESEPQTLGQDSGTLTITAGSVRIFHSCPAGGCATNEGSIYVITKNIDGEYEAVFLAVGRYATLVVGDSVIISGAHYSLETGDSGVRFDAVGSNSAVASGAGCTMSCWQFP